MVKQKKGKKKAVSSRPPAASKSNGIDPTDASSVDLSTIRTSRDLDRDRDRDDELQQGAPPPPGPGLQSSCPATESMDLSAAIALALRQTSRLPLGNDRSHLPIGAACRVYWDDECRWFTARVLLYDPVKDLHFIYYDEDGTTEWVDAGEDSPDAVQLAERLVVHKSYPATQFYTNKRAQEQRAFTVPPKSSYFEYFQHKKGQAPQYSIAPTKSGRSLLDCPDPTSAKLSMCLAFEHARDEFMLIKRTRELVFEACKAQLYSGGCTVGATVGPGRSSLLLGLRVRTSSCAISAISALFKPKHSSDLQLNAQDSNPIDDISGEPDHAPAVKLAKCFGTITDYCPGNDEHFVVFDNASIIAPKWVRIDRAPPSGINEVWLEQERQLVERDIARRPNDVELLVEWDFSQKQDKGVMATRDLKIHEVKEQEFIDLDMKKVDDSPVCGLCGLGNFEDEEGFEGQELGAVMTCCVCRDHHFHRHCMPMSRVSMSEDQSWRCWHCACCECCGISAWFRESHLVSLHDVLLEAAAQRSEEEEDCGAKSMQVQVLEQVIEQGEPLAPRGICQPCVDMLRTGKGYCSVCYMKYIDDTPLYAAPGKSKGIGKALDSSNVPSVPALAMGAAVAEESQQMVCCDECNEWVHSKCEGIDMSQYESIANGTHPVWGNEYLCPLCRIKLPLSVVNTLLDIDKSGIFHFPITTDIAKTYFDVIRNPMDLQTMRTKAGRGQYKALQALRADFELMCLNALTFNKQDDEYWAIARIFFNKGVAHFASLQRTTTTSAYGLEARELLKLARQSADGLITNNEEEKPKPKVKKPKVRAVLEQDDYKKSYVVHNRKKHDRGSSSAADLSTVSSYADLLSDDHMINKRRKVNNQGRGDGVAAAVTIDSVVGGANRNAVEDSTGQFSSQKVLAGLPSALFTGLPFASSLSSESSFMFSLHLTLQSLMPLNEHVVSSDVAFYSCCRDACGICSSSGSQEYFLYCSDCGECYHSFCVDFPLPEILRQESSLANTARWHKRVPARSRWKCIACNVTCATCHSVTCRNPLSPLLLDVSPEKGQAMASHFVSCSVCSVITHVGCISYLSTAGRMKLAGPHSDGADSKWVCEECCLCTCSNDMTTSKGEVDQKRNLKEVISSQNFVENRVGKAFFAMSSGRLWGFSSDECLRCSIRLRYLRRFSQSFDSISRSPALAWVPPFIQLQAHECGECRSAFQDQQVPLILCCALCFGMFHSHCCENQPSGHIGGHFVCRACLRSEFMLHYATSHVGKGKRAVELLQSVSDIQLHRKVSAATVKTHVLPENGHCEHSRLDVFNNSHPSCSLPPKPSSSSLKECWTSTTSFAERKRMLMLMVLVAWAARRLYFMGSNPVIQACFSLESSESSSSSSSVNGAKSGFPLRRLGNASVSKSVRKRSLQFLRLWTMFEGGDPQTDMNHKMSLLKGGLHISNTDGKEKVRPMESLVECAALATAFLHESGEEIRVSSHTCPELRHLQDEPHWLRLPPEESLCPLQKVLPLAQIMKEIEEIYLYLLSPECQLADMLPSGLRNKEHSHLDKRLRPFIFSAKGREILCKKTLKHPLPSRTVFPMLLTRFGLVSQAEGANLRAGTRSESPVPISTKLKQKQKLKSVKLFENDYTSTSKKTTGFLNDLVQVQLALVKKTHSGSEVKKAKIAKQVEIEVKMDSLLSGKCNTKCSSDDCNDKLARLGTTLEADISTVNTGTVEHHRCAEDTDQGDTVRHGGIDNLHKSERKDKKKIVKKDSDFYRTRWDAYESRHALDTVLRAVSLVDSGQDLTNTNYPFIRRMSTALMYSKTGWVTSSCGVAGNGSGGGMRSCYNHNDVVAAVAESPSSSGNQSTLLHSPVNNIQSQCSSRGEPGSVSKIGVHSGFHQAVSPQVVKRIEIDSADLRWESVECCTFCHGSEEEPLLGRLVPFTGSGGGSAAGGLWAHANCVRSAALCHEWPSGAVTGAERAHERALETLCTLCGEVGAAVKCEKVTCKDYFHLKCAIACDFSFSEGKKCRSGVLSKLIVRDFPRPEESARRRESGGKTSLICANFDLVLPPPTPSADRKYFTLSACCEAHRHESKKTPGPPDLRVLQNPLRKIQIVEDSYQEDAEPLGFVTSPTSMRTYNHLHTCTGMQHRPVGQKSRNTKLKSNVETYWEDRQNLIEQKISLLKAGGHGLRMGALTIHRLGTASFDLPGHHSADYIFPLGFKSSRIFWSRRTPMTRVLYTFEIQSAEFDQHNQQQRLLFPRPQFVVAISDEPDVLVVTNSIEQAFLQIVDKVKLVNAEFWPDMFASLASGAVGFRTGRGGVQSVPPGSPSTRHHPLPAATFSPPLVLARAAMFFGVGQDLVRYAIETQAEALAMMAPQLFFAEYPMKDEFPSYRPRFHLPSKAQLAEVLRRRAHQQQVSRKNLHGSSRAEGWVPDKRSINLALAGAGDYSEQGPSKDKKRSGSKAAKGSASKLRRGEALDEVFPGEVNDDVDEMEGARRKARLRRKYQELSERYQVDPFEKLFVKRSHIHGYGLYARVELAKDEMIIEYIGEQVRQVVADTREEAYEEQGLGSCYMFRLDKEYIVDATHTGSMARFINHCCEANAYARVIDVHPIDGEDSAASQLDRSTGPQPVEKRIVIFAGRTIQPGEEVTYDYKFPIEDEKLKCYCGAAKCRGTMN